MQEMRENIMAQLWGGRFTKETDKLVYNFNASISFDQKFYEQDIRGSKAHGKGCLQNRDSDRERERSDIRRTGGNPGRCESRQNLQSHQNMRISTVL